MHLQHQVTGLTLTHLLRSSQVVQRFCQMLCKQNMRAVKRAAENSLMILGNFYLCEESSGVWHIFKNTHTPPQSIQGYVLSQRQFIGIWHNLQLSAAFSWWFCSSKIELPLLAVMQVFSVTFSHRRYEGQFFLNLKFLEEGRILC